MLFFNLQDQLSADMYSFASKEGEYARYYVTVGALRFRVNELEPKWKYNSHPLNPTKTE